jgi:hypothetical protein
MVNCPPFSNMFALAKIRGPSLSWQEGFHKQIDRICKLVDIILKNNTDWYSIKKLKDFLKKLKWWVGPFALAYNFSPYGIKNQEPRNSRGL